MFSNGVGVDIQVGDSGDNLRMMELRVKISKRDLYDFCRGKRNVSLDEAMLFVSTQSLISLVVSPEFDGVGCSCQ